MNINVDRATCQNHGQCVISAPDSFWFDESGVLQWNELVTPEQAQDVEDAADVCPVQAIILEGTALGA